MKKLLSILFVAVVLTFAFKVPAFAAGNGTVLTLTASGTTSEITVSGTTSGVTAAVTVQVQDDSGISMESFTVLNNAFSGTISRLSLTNGKIYTVRAADYDGGNWKAVTISVRNGNVYSGVCETALHDGAKIRTSGAQGLMFGTVIDSDIKQLYIDSGYNPIAYGTVLLPADMIPAGSELTKDTNKAVYREFSASVYPDLAEYKVYLIGWTEESQMNRKITARSYVVYQKGEKQITVYSNNTVTRSVYTVSINIYNEDSGNPQLEDNFENGRTAYNWLIYGI